MIIIGEKSCNENKVEIKDRTEGQPIFIAPQEAAKLIKS